MKDNLPFIAQEEYESLVFSAKYYRLLSYFSTDDVMIMQIGDDIFIYAFYPTFVFDSFIIVIEEQPLSKSYSFFSSIDSVPLIFMIAYNDSIIIMQVIWLSELPNFKFVHQLSHRYFRNPHFQVIDLLSNNDILVVEEGSLLHKWIFCKSDGDLKLLLVGKGEEVMFEIVVIVDAV